jgi:hypothetical protein
VELREPLWANCVALVQSVQQQIEQGLRGSAPGPLDSRQSALLTVVQQTSLTVLIQPGVRMAAYVEGGPAWGATSTSAISPSLPTAGSSRPTTGLRLVKRY